MIKATGLTYAYEDGFDAVRGVDFEVYEGEFLAILGHNGSGKSTLAKLMNALFLPTGGEICVGGIVAKNEDDAFREIIVFDEATAMLDPSGRAEVMRVVREVNKTGGVTVIWITHFMEEAAQAERLLVMDEGKIAMQGAPLEVFTRVEEIRALGLDAPEMILLAEELRKRGIPAKDVMTVEEMVVELCR